MVLAQRPLGGVIGGALREVAPLDVLDEVRDHALVVEALPGIEHLAQAAWVSGRRGMKSVQQSGAVSQQMS